MHRRNLSAAAVFAVGLLLSTGLYFLVNSIDSARIRTRFDFYAAQHLDAFEQSLRLTTRSIEALAALFQAVPNVSRYSFSQFTTPLIQTDHTIQALEWAHHVLANQRSAMEYAARADGYAGFSFTEHVDAGMRPEAQRPDYFPVYYVEPLKGNEPAVGFDLASNPARRRALQSAVDAGRITATERIVLVQETGNQYGFLVFVPVYAQGSHPETVVDRRAALRGVVLGVFRVGDIVKRSTFMSDKSEQFTKLKIYDVSAPVGGQLLFPKGDAEDRSSAGANAVTLTRTIAVGGRQWRVEATPSAYFNQVERDDLAPMAFIGALLLTSMSCVYYWLNLRHRERTERVESLLYDALESISEGFAFYDENDRLVMCNESYRRLYPQSAEAIILGARFEDILRTGLRNGQYAEAAGHEEQWLAERLREHRESHSEIEQELSDGRWLLVSERRTRNGGVAGLRVDITALKNAQRQLMHSQKLEALGTLAGGVAHDLNNSLVPVLALARLILDELPESGRFRGEIEMIMTAGERARNLVKQILTFSRKQDVRKTETDLATVIEQSLRMLRATLPANVRIDATLGSVPSISADGGQIQQVIVNLVTNAAQAIGDRQGQIAVCLEATTANADGADSAVRLRIADTGCGIDPKILDRIFEPFFTTKGVGEGTGLGLSVVHGIVTDHGGRIEVSSELGRGTVVTIYLPVSRSTVFSLDTRAA